MQEALAGWRAVEAWAPDACADASLADLAGEVMRSSHRESEKHRPAAEAVLEALGQEEREKVVLWLFQVCAHCHLDDAVLYAAVLLLDSYCAGAREPLGINRLHLIVISILSISMKVTGGEDEVTKPRKLRELLAFLGQQRFSVQMVFATELEVLRGVNYQVSTPTPLDFLNALVLPLASPPVPGCGHAGLAGAAEQSTGSPVACLARFLLQLSMLDVQLHYRYPHAALAAGAAYVALWCTRARPERTAALLSDVRACEAEDGPEAIAANSPQGPTEVRQIPEGASDNGPRPRWR